MTSPLDKTDRPADPPRVAKRVQRVYLALAIVVFVLIVFPLGGVLTVSLNRLGTSSGTVVATGAATIQSCEQHAFGVPYTCQAAVTWQPDPILGETRDTVSEVRAATWLSGTVSVQERYCSAKGARLHTCPVVTTDYPVRSGATYLLFAVLIVAYAVALFPLRKLAWRLVGVRRS
jgi:hypothetical protein